MSSTTPLNPRQKHVLTAIVDHYIIKAEPVSSKILSQSPILSASSATIRNTMVELEGLGMVEQPHASAGRLPTDRGYRVYVDELMYPQPLAASDKVTLDLLHNDASHEAKVVMAAKTLADMTRLLGLVIPPDHEQVIFRKMSLVRVEEDKIVVVVTGSNDEARSLLVESGSEVSFFRLEAVIQKLNLEMKGKPVSLLNDILNDKMEKSASKDDIQALDVLGRSILKLSKTESGDDVIVHGVKYLMNRPDFTKIYDFEAIMDLLDSKITLVHFLRQKGNTEGVHVTVGEEHDESGLFRAFSLVTSAFTLGGAQGVVGVLGPKRIPYARLVPVVAYAAQVLSGAGEKQEME